MDPRLRGGDAAGQQRAMSSGLALRIHTPLPINTSFPRKQESITCVPRYGMYITVSYKSFHSGFVDSMRRTFQARFHFLRRFSL